MDDPALKAWVMTQFSKMTDANRAAAQAEMKQVIAEAYNNKTLGQVDWSLVTLKSLEAPQSPLITKNIQKRKLQDSFAPNKKANKGVKSLIAPTASLSFDEREQRAKRAKRFEREAELEKQRANSRPLAQTLATTGPPNSYALPRKFQRHSYVNNDDEDVVMADPNVMDWDRYTIVGRSQQLFKNYLRLTSEPDPNDIRPLSVLEKTLAELNRRWKAQPNYPWICDQFKSLRQDLTVQRIKNEFTVRVYEVHARMALETNDVVEYNQCQAALRQLYELGIKGRNDEFLAYRILYMLHAKNRAELNVLVGQLTAEQKAQAFVRHALDVQTALATSNYHAFFVLYLKAPNMGGYIMDHFADRERVKSLIMMSKAYNFGTSLAFITKELAFDSVNESHTWLLNHQAACYVKPEVPNQEKVWDGKAAWQGLTASYEEKYRRVGIKGSI